MNRTELLNKQNENIDHFLKAQELLYQLDFANAEIQMNLYRRNINYEVFESTDNRKTAAPELSVIVVAYSTNDLLIDCLNSLLENNNEPFEIIVVDNGKNESVEDKIKQMPVLYIKCPTNFILSEGRNIGVHFAKSPVISFLDDDAVVKSGYVKYILEAFESYNIFGLRGKVLGKTEKWKTNLPKTYDLGNVPVPSSIDAEGNSAFLREKYLEFDGMNPLLFGGEGLDLTLRVIQKYGPNYLIYWPAAVIFHDPSDGAKDDIKNDRYVVMHKYLEWKYPNLWGIYSYLEQYSLSDENRVIGYNTIEKKNIKPVVNENLSSKLSCMFVATYYNKFLDKHYQKRPELFNAGYDEQLSSLVNENFGDSNYYSLGMNGAGWSAQDIICNCLPLQSAWKKEHNIEAEGFQILIEQIKFYKPDVVYFHDMNLMPADLLNAIKPYVKLIAGQIATPIEQKIPFNLYDVIFSSFPHYIKKFREAGLTAYYTPLAFDSRNLDSLNGAKYEKNILCSFVGGISAYHIEGNKLINEICANIPVQIWGYGVETLPQDSPIRTHYNGEAWGKDMFNILSHSLVTINRHGEVAENYANNMRLFEATGCGTLLITDYKDNLDELFEIGKEIVAFRSNEEAIALTKYYITHPEEAIEIAKAGQKRTLSDHTYEKRMKKTAEILERHLNYKNNKNTIIAGDQTNGVSKAQLFNNGSVPDKIIQGWKDERIPQRQRAAVQQELELMYKGRTPDTYKALIDLLSTITRNECSILDAGCSSGYYYEIIEYLLNRQIKYTGTDYSEHFISMAKKYYPGARFLVADGASLPLEKAEFDVVISGNVVSNTPDYQKHIEEIVKAAKEHIIFHSIPVSRKRNTQFQKKYAYGVETLEIRFNEKELFDIFTKNSVKVLKMKEVSSDSKNDRYTVSYLLKK